VGPDGDLRCNHPELDDETIEALVSHEYVAATTENENW
jgi:hypothetical protein